MTPERIEQLVNQALAFDAVSDPRGQVEMTIRQAIKEASAPAEVVPPNRYDIHANEFHGSCTLDVEDATDGKWVLWDDIKSHYGPSTP